MLNPPAVVQSAQHGLTVQVRVRAPKTAGKQDASTLFVPPMTPIFKTNDTTNDNRFGKRRPDEWNPVQPCHGQFLDNADDAYDSKNFVGVSTDGLVNFHDVHKHGEKMSHFTVTTRGIVTVMCNYEDACKLPLLSHVKVAKSQHTYRGMPMKAPFTLALCNDDEVATKSIGKLVSKPTEVNRANEVRLLLF
jgi:hypothetical protein